MTILALIGHGAKWLGLLLGRSGAEWVVRRAAAELAPDAFAAASARGQALDREQTVARIMAALDDLPRNANET